MKPYTGGIVMPQNAETLLKKKHDRLMDNIQNLDGNAAEWFRWANELNSLNSPHIDRRPKK